jgi:hypothetical protein
VWLVVKKMMNRLQGEGEALPHTHHTLALDLTEN